MRRSAVVQLTLLPLVASAAIASAEPGPPGETEPVLSPPGLTPTEDDCVADPTLPFCDLEYFACDADDPDCEPAVAIVPDGGIIRGGFGGYFWVSHS